MKNKYKSSMLTFLLALVFAVSSMAQDNQIKGTVTDATNGEPIPGVNIMEKGTFNGSLTDNEGNYTIEVGEDAVLVFSFVGFAKEEIEVGDRSAINVSLSPDIQELQEIVVIGYGEQKKEDATGSVTAISEKEFNKGSITTPQELLVGRVSGVNITTNGGAPGADSKIRIRGGSSLSASNNPLIVIDGVPLDDEAVTGLRNPLSTVNPNDIESVSVLKDASATAIYGSRASNGVIIITTKRGREGEELSLNYSGKFSLQTVNKTVDALSADEYRDLITSRVDDENTTFPPNEAVELLGNANTNWQDQILSDALMTDHNISATGAYKSIPYRFSVGYTNQDGILNTSNFERTSFSVGIDPSLFDDHLQIKTNFKGMFANNRFANNGAIGAAITFDPTQPVRDPQSPFGGYYFWSQRDSTGAPTDAPVTIATDNPVAMLELNNDQASVNRYIGNVQFDYKLHFLPDLRANLNVATDRSYSDGEQIESVNLTSTYDPENGSGTNRVYDQEKRNDLLEFYLNYKKDLPTISSMVDVMAGYSWQNFWRKSSEFSTNAEGNFVKKDDDFRTENFLVSFYGRLNYTLMDRYLFTFTVRRDGSSRFLGDNQWGTFPSAAFAWKIDKESFLRESDLISELKLRLGYGITGQQNINQGDYPALARVTYSDDNARYQIGDNYLTTIRYEGFDANLKWEETTTYNAGLDFGFLGNRFTGSVDAYFRETRDLLNEIPVPIGTNFTNRILTNVGSLENKGIEVALNGYIIDREDLSWNLGANFTYNENEITDLTLVDDPDYLGVLVGGIGGGVGNTVQVHSVGHPANSFFVYEQVYNQEGDPIEGLYVDQNEDGIINDFDRVRYKNPNPDMYMGFSSRVSYNNFDFSFNARANLRNYIYNNVSSQYGQYQNLYNSAGYLNNVTTEVYASNFNQPQYLSRYYIEDGSFFRMDNMTLGYNFQDIAFNKLDLYLNFTVQNAFVITNYSGLDPEVEGTEADDSGIDNNVYPRPRTYIFGVNLRF